MAERSEGHLPNSDWNPSSIVVHPAAYSKPSCGRVIQYFILKVHPVSIPGVVRFVAADSCLLFIVPYSSDCISYTSKVITLIPLSHIQTPPT